MTGSFLSPTLPFDTVTLNYNNGSTFITKFDMNGNTIWAKNFGKISGGIDIALDSTNGDILITGTFGDTVMTIDTVILINQSPGDYEIFVARYSSQGNFKWAKSIGGKYWDRSNAITVDKSGNAYITGYVASDTVYVGSDTLFTDGVSGDIFIAKYDPFGNPLWAKSFGGNWLDYGADIAADPLTDEIYISGRFDSDTITFGTYTFINTTTAFGADADYFLLKLSPFGNVIWAVSAIGKDNDVGASISVEKGTGNIYVAGYFLSDTITIGAITLINTAQAWTPFIVKYDSAGNTIWAKNPQCGLYSSSFLGLTINPANKKLLFAGWFQGSAITFDAVTVNAGNPSGNGGLVVIEVDTAGTALWGLSGGGGIVNAVASNNGDIFCNGSFSFSSVTIGSTTLTNAGVSSSDIFLAKISPFNSVQETGQQLFSSLVFPNPFCATATLLINDFPTGNFELSIYDSFGNMVKQQLFNNGQTIIDENNLAKGLYIYKIANGNKQVIATGKFIIQ